jgi:Nucleotidyltransferase domain
MNLKDDPLLHSLIARLDQPGVIGIALVGSYARGENKPYSDVDLDLFMEELPALAGKYTLRYFDGKLISLKYILLADEYASLTQPQRVIWAVPGIKQMQILLDKTGQLAALKQAALDFKWQAVHQAAQEFAEEQLMGCAEEAHKILSGLSQQHESKVLYALWGLLEGLSNAVAVQRGLMMDSENRYFDIIQDSLGREHAWVKSFRLALGAEHSDVKVPAYQTRGKWALETYKQTAILFKDIITDKHRTVIENTLQLIPNAVSF